MPKKKTSKSAAKRLKVTAGGKVKFKHPGRGHLLTNKTRKHKRGMRKPGILSKDAVKHVRDLIAM